jgi:aquaporin Z
MAMIYSLSAVSGAHMNPAVTFAFALRGAFPWRRVLPYWCAALAGALLAAATLRFVLGDVAHLGTSEPGLSMWSALGMEFLLSLLLVSVILGTATHHAVVGRNAAIAVGGTVALCGLFARPISGASMNPARSLGPALVSGQLAGWWIYVLGPFAGALVAVLLARLIHGREDASEQREATGSG